MASVNIVQAKGDYIHIKTEDRNYVVHSTLKKIEDKLPKDLFFKSTVRSLSTQIKLLTLKINSSWVKDVVQ
jgi:hypothetical protein